MPLQGAEGKSGNVRAAVAVLAVALVGALLSAAPSEAAEPNNDFATATGPINAGQTFNSSLEEATDVDFHFFYVPDPTQVTVTTLNRTQKRGGAADRAARSSRPCCALARASSRSRSPIPRAL